MEFIEMLFTVSLFIMLGLWMEARIYSSFAKAKRKRQVARSFGFIFLALVIIILFVMPSPIMDSRTCERYPWLLVFKAGFFLGLLLQIVFRIVNEVRYASAKSQE